MPSRSANSTSSSEGGGISIGLGADTAAPPERANRVRYAQECRTGALRGTGTGSDARFGRLGEADFQIAIGESAADRVQRGQRARQRDLTADVRHLNVQFV